MPFNGMFLYVLSTPVFLGELLRLAPEEFFWFFLLSIAGIMSGAFCRAGWPARSSPRGRSATASSIMAACRSLNLVLDLRLRGERVVGPAADRASSRSAGP